MSDTEPDTGSKIEYMNLNDFVTEGFLQEANRLFFHPLGLALEVGFNKRKNADSIRIWDYRSDDEGIVFGEDMIEMLKVAKVHAERMRHAQFRMKLFNGVTIQPVPSPKPDA